MLLKNSSLTRSIRVLLAVAVFSLPCTHCSPPEQPDNATAVTPADSPQIPDRGFYKGILPIPGDGQTIDGAYKQAALHAEWAPVWAGGIGSSGFWDFAGDLAGESGTLFVEQLVRGNRMFPIINFSFIDKDPETGLLALKVPENMPGATLSDPAWRALYKQAVLDALTAVRPLYLSIGNEVNRWYEQYGIQESDPDGFQHFVSLYEEIYGAAKQLSPETNIFCVFSREIVDELREADLNVLNLFDPATLDIIVFTSYPHSVRKVTDDDSLTNPFNSPDAIPDDYYAKILGHVPDKLIGFSEIGWPSTDFYGGEQGQAAFISEVTGRLSVSQGIDLHLFGWPWLHDLDETDDMGLIKSDGTEKAAYTVWKNL